DGGHGLSPGAGWCRTARSHPDRVHTIPGCGRAAGRPPGRWTSSPGGRGHRVRPVPDHGGSRGLAGHDPVQGGAVMSLLTAWLQIDVTHPTTAVAGIEFNGDTIRNTLIVCALLIAVAPILRSQLHPGLPGPLQNATEALFEYLRDLTESTLEGRGIALVP